MAVVKIWNRAFNLTGGKGDEVNPKHAFATPSYSSLKLCLWVPRIWVTAGLTV